jgi:NhaP-type Na+/H+ or K+/H+ antiporter
MYETAAAIAAFLLVYTAVSGRVESSWLSGPVVFTAAGVLLGPVGLGLLKLKIDTEVVRILAEGTLAMVLFTDAANANFAVVRRYIAIPGRLLLIGLPLTIILGFFAAQWLFPGLGVLEAALIATILAPTDAALGKPVVTNPSLADPIREGLNLESGLNDGICVPIVLILLALAVGTSIEGRTSIYVIEVVAEALGIGLAVGLAATGCATLLLRATVKRGWVSEDWVQVPVVALAIVCYAAAQASGGSGFIACFVGGLMVSWLAPRRKHELLRSAESIGASLAMLTWLAFGAFAVGQVIDRLTVSAVIYAALSLTVIRMAPVFLCLLGSGTNTVEKLFVGWFGPRGLATIVFAIIILNEHLPGNDTLAVVVVCTVVLSVVAHGMTANPFLRLTRSWMGSSAVNGPQLSRRTTA